MSDILEQSVFGEKVQRAADNNAAMPQFQPPRAADTARAEDDRQNIARLQNLWKSDLKTIATAQENPEEFYSRVFNSMVFSNALHLPVEAVWSNYDVMTNVWAKETNLGMTAGQAIVDQWDNGWLNTKLAKEYEKLRAMQNAYTADRYGIMGSEAPAGSLNELFQSHEDAIAEQQEVISKLVKQRDAIPMDTESRGILIDAVKSMVNIAPMMIDMIPETVGATLAGGAMGGLGAAGRATGILGRFGALAAAVAQEGALAGGIMGFMKSKQLEGGLFYGDMIEAGIPHDIADSYSEAVGVINGAIEMVQFGNITRLAGGKSIPGEFLQGLMEKALKNSIVKKRLLKGVAKFAGGVVEGALENTLEEILQETTSILAEEGAKVAANELGMEFSSILDEFWPRIAETAKQSLLGMGLLAVPGAAADVMFQGNAEGKALKRVAQEFHGVDPMLTKQVNSRAVSNPEEDPVVAGVREFMDRQAETPTILVDDRGAPQVFFTAGTEADGVTLYREYEDAAQAAQAVARVPSPQAVLKAITENHGEEAAKLAAEGKGDFAAAYQAAKNKAPAWAEYGKAGIQATVPNVAMVFAQVTADEAQNVIISQDNEAGVVRIKDPGAITLVQGYDSTMVVPSPTAQAVVDGNKIILKDGDQILGDAVVEGDTIVSLPENPHQARAILAQHPDLKMDLTEQQVRDIISTPKRKALERTMAANGERARELKTKYLNAQEDAKEAARSAWEQAKTEADAKNQALSEQMWELDKEILGEDRLVASRVREETALKGLQDAIMEAAEKAGNKKITQEHARMFTRLVEIRAMNQGITASDWSRKYLSADPFRGIEQFEEGQRGSVDFKDADRATITLTAKSDVTTLVHEFGHILRRQLDDGDQAKLLAHYKSDTWDVATEEAFAADWENVFLQGEIAPSGLENIFRKLVHFFRMIYQGIRAMVDPEVREVLDRAFIQDGTAHGLTVDQVEAEIHVGNPLYAPSAEMVREMMEAANRRQEDTNRLQSYEHELTGLPNRRAWERDIQNQEYKGWAIVSLDADSLKFLNDTFDHLVGDKMLKIAGDAIKAAGETHGVKYYHVSGDEFRFLAPDVEKAVLAKNEMDILLSDATIEEGAGDGYTAEISIRVTAGFAAQGEGIEAAESHLAAEKRYRESLGLRGKREEIPPSIRIRDDQLRTTLDGAEAGQRIRGLQETVRRIQENRPGQLADREAHLLFYRKRIAEKYGQNPELLYQKAWHGSPHRFERFTTDKMGSGEGAQAYGWGLYFAGDKEVAEWYRRELSSGLHINGKPFFIKGKKVGSTGNELADDYIIANFFYPDEALKEARNDMAGIDANGKYGAEYLAEMQPVVDLLEKLIEKKAFENRGAGQLYEVEIPDHEDFMGWDKPISEQPGILKKLWAIKELGDLYPSVVEALQVFELASSRGSTIYHSMVRDDKIPEMASRSLKAVGIPGIRYLDGNSRGDGAGNYNYVVFDEADVEVVNTYYQPSKLEQIILQKGIETIEDDPSRKKSLQFGKASDVLLKHGIEYDLLFPNWKVWQAMKPDGIEPHAHGLTKNDMKASQFGLHEPAYIFASQKDEGVLLVVTGDVDYAGRPIMVAIKHDGYGKRSIILSMYGRNGFMKFFSDLADSGMMLHYGEKKAALLDRKVSRQLAATVTKKAKNNYTTDADFDNGTLYQPAEDIRQKWAEQGVTVDYYVNPTTKLGVLSALKVPPAMRGQGVAREAMSDIITNADEEGITIRLSPTSEWGASKSRLTDFYKQFGFVENKGRNKDYRFMETMYRLPVQKSLYQSSWYARRAKLIRDEIARLEGKLELWGDSIVHADERTEALAELNTYRKQLADNREMWLAYSRERLAEGKFIEPEELQMLQDEPDIDEALMNHYMATEEDRQAQIGWATSDLETMQAQDKHEERTIEQHIEDFTAGLDERLEKWRETARVGKYGKTDWYESWGRHSDRMIINYLNRKGAVTTKRASYDRQTDKMMEGIVGEDNWQDMVMDYAGLQEFTPFIRMDLDMSQHVERYLAYKGDNADDLAVLKVKARQVLLKDPRASMYNMALAEKDYFLLAEYTQAEKAALDVDKTESRYLELKAAKKEIQRLQKARASEKVQIIQDFLKGKTIERMSTEDQQKLDKMLKKQLDLIDQEIQQKEAEVLEARKESADLADKGRAVYEELMALEKAMEKGDRQHEKRVKELQEQRVRAERRVRDIKNNTIEQLEAQIKELKADVRKIPSTEKALEESSARIGRLQEKLSEVREGRDQKIQEAEELGRERLRELREKKNATIDALKKDRSEQIAALKASYRLREEKRAYARAIMIQPGKNVDAAYAIQILDLQEVFRGMRNLQRTKTIRTKLELLRDSQPDLWNQMPETIKAIVIDQKIEAWTVEQLEDLLGKIETLRAIGKAVYQQRKEEEAAEVRKIQNDILGQLKDQPGPEGKQPRIHSPDGTFREKILEMVEPQQFFDTLDGKADYQGAFMRGFHDLLADAKAGAYRKMLERRAALQDQLKTLEIKDLQRFDPFLVNDEKFQVTTKVAKKEFRHTLTMEDATGIYMIAQNDKGLKALQRGNLLPDSLIAYINQNLPKEWKALGDWIIEHGYGDHTNRLAEVYYWKNNAYMGREERYSPLVRRDVAGGQLEGDIRDEILRRNQQKRTPQKGFTEKRIEISEPFQSAVRLDALTLFNEMIEKQELYIHMTRPVSRLIAVQGGLKGTEVKHAIANKHGPESNRYINEWIARSSGIIAPRSAFERYVLNARSNLSAAMLGFNIGSALKQVAGFTLTFGEIPAWSYLQKIPGNLVHFKEMHQRMVDLSPEMANRVIDISVFTPVQSQSKAKAIAGKIRDASFLMQQWMDTATVTVAWNAAYDHFLKKTGSQEQAIRQATNMISRTQPTGDHMENSALISNKGIISIFTAFASASSKIWNNLAHLPDWSRRDQVQRYMVRVFGIALGAYIFTAMGKAALWPDDDDDKRDFVLNVLADSSFGNIPIIGSGLRSAVMGYSAKFPVIGGVFDAVQRLVQTGERAADGKDMTTQQVYGTLDAVFEGASILTGAPYLQIKRIFQGAALEDPMLALKKIIIGAD